MTELDEIAGPLAQELIEEFGKVITLRPMSATEYNVETGSSEPTGDPVTVKAVVEDYDLIGSGSGFAAGLIEDGDKKITIPALSVIVNPTPGDEVGMDGATYTIVNIKVVYSGELAALYVIQARS